MADRITVTLPDGSARALPEGATGADLATDIGPGLAAAAVAATVDGATVDLSRPLPDGAQVAIVTSSSEEGRAILRHSTAHVLAQAVLDLWPGARFAVGPPIEDGFYYDFELPGGAHFSEEDLATIEARMRQIVAEGQPFRREEHSIEEGLALFADQPFKAEIIDGVAGAGATGEGDGDRGLGAGEGASAVGVTTYRNTAGFVDLCRGPHVPSTDRLGAFKLLRVAGAYWRGDEHRPQLQRIYGTAWESTAALSEHLHRLEEAERRDHRRLGVELDLFHFPAEVGSGLAVFHPKGGLVRRLLEDYARAEHEAAGYQFVYTPHLARSTLFETSGHLEWFADAMYPPMEVEGQSYHPKPMNCPLHVVVYKAQSRSYRELPLRLFELGTVYRYERSGVLHGLLRARGFTQDDAHIFCTPEQLEGELADLLSFILRLLSTFGFADMEADLSTRPERSAGEPEEWDQAEAALATALSAAGLDYRVAEGEGSYYAPKIDVHVRDAIGRRWQMSTLQVDFQQPRRFEAAYTGPDNAPHRPFMIHRALFGSVERFLGILLEHYAGALPTWLAPVQARVLPVRDDHETYAAEVVEGLRAGGLRAEAAAADEPLGARIRRAKLEKLPYVLVVGDEDAEAGTVGVNARGGDRPERGVGLGEFLTRVRTEVADRRVAPLG
ncbi:MAG TPA: threonine--tRNA ligase [Acidimicrobiales bacterium]|nr:threonine--tRNA ligase [Acidimicrobiales bacterium]